MNHSLSKIKAILEVVAVFILTFLIIWAIQIPPLGQWQRHIFDRPFFAYMVMIAVPLLLLILMRRKLANYGISFKNLKYHLDIALICFLPAALAGALGYFLGSDHESWEDTLISVAINVGLLLSLAWLLRKKPTAGSMVNFSALLFVPNIILSSGPMGKVASAFFFYFLFVGFGEEILFRGYIQSRLNKTFGRPYRFFGVSWGWGIIITSLVFGFMHVVSRFNPFLGQFSLTWLFGITAFFGGLVFGFIREKAGSIVAPAIAHGLPQAIAFAYLGL